jgi:hypothetical protein
MRIIVDIDDATGAVTITPETQDPEAAILNSDTVECVADGMTHKFHGATGSTYRWHEAGRQLDIFDSNRRWVRSIARISISATMTGPYRYDRSYRVGLPVDGEYRDVGFGDYADAVAFAEWLESVGGPQRDRGGSELALDTFTFDAPKRAAGRDKIKRALDSVHMPERLSGCRVVVDWTGAEAVTTSAVHETVLWLYQRNTAAVEFVTDNKDVADTIWRVLGWEDVATLLPITLVDSSGEPETEPVAPEPTDTTAAADPVCVATIDFDGCTYGYNQATGDLSKDEGDGPVIVTTVTSQTKVYVHQDNVLTYAVVGFIDRTRIPFAYLSEAMEFCRWLADRRSHVAISGVDYDIFRQTVLFKVDGACRCEWDPAASTLLIRFVDGSIQVCAGVTPGMFPPCRLAGESAGRLDTLTGSEHVVFETEEQAETFVARLAEAFEKGKA